MSEIKNVGYTLMAKCNQLTPLPFKGLIAQLARTLSTMWQCTVQYATYTRWPKKWERSALCSFYITHCL